MDKLVLAYEVAKKFHEGQKDRAGKPYINHVKFVSDQVLPLGEEYALVGMLHDTLEDTAMDRGTLDYVRQIKESGNPYAIAVKKADLRNNMDLTRLSEVTEKDRERVEKYRKAYGILSEA